MSQSQVSTNVGSSTSRPGGSTPRSAASGIVRQRRTGGASTSRAAPSTGSTGFLGFSMDDAPGIKVGPVTALVSSAVFIAAVLLMHIGSRMF
ncbi:hypothetical protein CAOG_04704 [Capsaspora owczarzaki ATCC 30864]|uniref:Protein transport protein Sec61 subunit beta n=1 Tax=Capsaspora owczarzaki (strain ATCC 30864) TaxID=595528 RepID=A0A0D2WRR3_CAPO3|nr:hypothetical protein CAOG_04704 [Capsaspora owczarzaki ATCC 30864]KJE93998.1 hypothetical protein CAOG_004704 [Capsaspora owczarzaki ATCC 30864]|eukprot:XP_004347451.1 hypothetical protein CAOG_04704 [Capsaspora owczarzaki ATCC 30864]